MMEQMGMFWLIMVYILPVGIVALRQKKHSIILILLQMT
jgi:hypothetical protein